MLTATFDRILVYVGFALNLNAAAAVLAAFVLRRREPAADRPYRAPLWPLPGVLFLALAAFMTVFAVRERPKETRGRRGRRWSPAASRTRCGAGWRR